MVKLTIPTTVAPRYTPSMADETAMKIGNIQQELSAEMSMTLKILMQSEILSVTSPSHDIVVTERTNHGDYSMNIAEFSAFSTKIERDIIVYVECDEPNKPKVMVE